MAGLKGRDLLSLADLSAAEVAELLELAIQMKAGATRPRCEGKVLGLLFYKNSTRTRVSFDVAMHGTYRGFQTSRCISSSRHLRTGRLRITTSTQISSDMSTTTSSSSTNSTKSGGTPTESSFQAVA